MNMNMNMNIVQKTIKRQGIVGSLLIYEFSGSIQYSLAVWKIVKMERIKNHSNLTYRCSVFDIGASIQLNLENDHASQSRIYGPVRFDPHLAKQLQASIANNWWFSINVFLKSNQTFSTRIRPLINESCKLQIHLQIKKQILISIQVPVKQDWRDYQQVFSIDNVNLTEVCIKNIQHFQTLKTRLVNFNFQLKDRNDLLISFSNVVQRNIFLAQIILKTRDRNIPGNRHSQMKSVANSEQKSAIDNQIDDLFNSNLSDNPRRSSLVSQKVLNDMKDVVFTPQQSTQNQGQKQIDFSVGMFKQFLNPEQIKKKSQQKLSDIQEQQIQCAQRSANNNPSEEKKVEKQVHFIPKKSLNSRIKSNSYALSRSKKIFSKQVFDELVQENENLVCQNKKLKRQNQNLQFKLKKYNSKKIIGLKYELPQFLQRTLVSRDERVLSNNTIKVGPKQGRKIGNKSNRQCSDKQIISSWSTNYQQQLKQSGSTQNFVNSCKKRNQMISMSAKTVKRFVHSEDYSKSK